jgi:hypothetical protein
MKQLADNLSNDIYPEVNKYLVEERFLSLQTLKKFNVGIGSEKFYNQDDEVWVNLECVYFPMYSPLS